MTLGKLMANDAFQDKFGEFLEEVLQDIHDEHCPDSDVLMPIAHLAKNIQCPIKVNIQPMVLIFVETENIRGKDTKLVILKYWTSEKTKQVIVWTGK